MLSKSSGLPFCPVWNSAFLSVGFILQQPLLHRGKMATSSSWVSSYNVATPEPRVGLFPSCSGKSPEADSQQSGRLCGHPGTHHCGSGWPGLDHMPSPEPKGGIWLVVWIEDELKGEGCCNFGWSRQGRPVREGELEERPEGGEGGSWVLLLGSWKG